MSQKPQPSPKPQESNGSSATIKKADLIPREIFEREIRRLEAEQKKGDQLIEQMEPQLKAIKTDMLLINSHLSTLKRLLQEADDLAAQS